MPNPDNERPRPCGIFIDAEGEWYHGENRITRPEILELLYEKLDLAPGGEYVLADPKGKCLLDVADTPFVVSRVDRESCGAAGERIVLGLKHIAQPEVLDPRTLCVGQDCVLYCRIRDGRFPARFSRPAYYQIAAFIEESPEGGFYILLDGIEYFLANG
ncbi:MAG: hypothetical protein WAW37_17380 [Syntrophobacteraceae bacterium]